MNARRATLCSVTMIPAALMALLATLMASSAFAAVGRTPTSFNVSNTGEAQYTVPIAAPPGIRGLAPQMALTYAHRSGMGSGWMGAGWELSGLSAITRCPKTWAQDGVAKPVLLDMTDRFCLDGQQLKLESGSYGGDGAVYRTEIESFARITSYGVAGSGPQWFQVQSKDGRIYDYGNRADSRIEALGSSTARTWALTTARDRDDNRIEFNYTKDTTYGAYRIDNIQWTTNPTMGINSAPYTLQFLYETQPANEFQNGYSAGKLVKDVNRMTRIDITYNSTLIRRYSVAYEASLSSASHSRIASITECAGSAGTDCLAPTTFDYQNGTNAFNAPVTQSLSAVPGTRTMILDVNGDGRGDFVYPSAAGYTTGTWQVALADANGNYPAVTTTAVSSYFQAYSTPIDYNADGKIDLLLTDGSNWLVATSNGSGFDTPIDTGISAVGATDVRALDVDGDGLEDLVYVQDNIVYWRQRIWGGTFSATANVLATGGVDLIATSFESDVQGRNHGQGGDFNGDGHADLIVTFIYRTWTGNDWLIYVDMDVVLSGTNGQVFYLGDQTGGVIGDFNGDGLSDYAISNATNWVYQFSNGATFTLAVNGPSVANQQTWAAIACDWDGDGFSDILVPDFSNVWQVIRSTGETLATPISTGFNAGALDSMFTLDANGDGLLDALWVGSASGTVQTMQHAGVLPDLLASATDGFGNTVSIVYNSVASGACSVVDNPAPTYPYRRYQGALSIVCLTTASDGNGSTFTRTPSYYNAVVNLQGRGFMGFDRLYQSDSRDNIVHMQSFSVTFPLGGMVSYSLDRQSDWTSKISEVSNAFSSIVLPLGGTGFETRVVPYLSASNVYSYGVGNATNGVLLRSSGTTNTIDPTSGMIVDTTTTITEASTGNGVSPNASWVQRTYVPSLLNDTANWCLAA